MTGGHLTTCVICYFYINRQGNIQKKKQWEYTGSEKWFAPICQESLKLDLNDLIGWMVTLCNQTSHFMHGYAYQLELFQ